MQRFLLCWSLILFGGLPATTLAQAPPSQPAQGAAPAVEYSAEEKAAIEAALKAVREKSAAAAAAAAAAKEKEKEPPAAAPATEPAKTPPMPAPVEPAKATPPATETLKVIVDPPLATPKALNQRDIYNTALRSTAFVVLLDKDNKILSSGSGWVLDLERKLLVTNFHVINQPANIRVFFPAFENGRVVSDRDSYYRGQKAIPAEILATNSVTDLAALKLASIPEGVTALPLAEASPSPGEMLHSIGSPGSSAALWIYTTGTVRAVYRAKRNAPWGQFEATIIESQSPINSGDSGGPAVNDYAQLVGVVSSHTVNAQLLSQFIDISEVKKLAELARDFHAPSTAAHYIARAKQYNSRGNTHQAISDLSAGLKLDRNNPEALTCRGDCFRLQGDMETAVADYNEAIKLDPNYMLAYTGRALLYQSQKKLDLALADATQAIRLEVDNSYPSYLRGLMHYEKGDFSASVSDFNRALTLIPNHSRYLYHRARAQQQLGAAQEAIKDYVAATKLDPTYLDAYCALGDFVLEQRKDPKDAVFVFTEAIKHLPQSVYPHVKRGRAYLLLDQVQLALDDLNKAIELNPNFAMSYDYRGDIHLARRDYAAATNDYQAALKLDANNPIYHFDLGNVLTRMGNQREALVSYDKAVQLAPKYADAYLNRAIVNYKLGNREQSREDVRKAAEINPRFADMEVQNHHTRFLRITNATSEPIEVYVYYYTPSINGKWTWYPFAPESGGSPVSFRIEAKESGYLKHNDIRVHGAEVRVWAKSLNSDKTSNKFKDESMRIAPDEGYISIGRETFDYTFNEAP